MNKKYSQNGFTAILILLVGVLIGGVVVGAYYLGTQKTNKTEVPKTSASVTPAPSTPATNSDETADWKVYTASTYSVKYPIDFEIKEEEASTVTFFKRGPTQKEATELYDGIALRFQPREIANAKAMNFAKSLIEETTRNETGEVTEEPKSITINNYQGVSFTVRGLGIHKIIVLEGSNSMLMYIIDSTADPNKQGYQETANKILSTFKFTN